MRHLFRAALATLLLLGPAASLAHAVTIADLINLRANGVSDDILIALIQSDGTVFKLTAEDIIALKKRGLSDRVLVAMITAGKQATDPVVESTPADQYTEPIAADGSQRTRVESDGPTVVNVTQQVTQHVEQTHIEREYVPYPVVVPVFVPSRPVKEQRPPAPQYWGYGGKQRPDSWEQPRTSDRRPDSRPEPKSDSKPTSKSDAKPETKSDSKSEKPTVKK